MCARPLADGGGLRVQGEQLVHAGCWRPSRRPAGDAEGGAPNSPLAPSGDAGPLTGVRILVVEDHGDSRDALRQILEQVGAMVRCAGNGPDALATAEREPPDLVLCDLRMPGMDGFAVLSALHTLPASHPIRVVAVSGLGRDDDLERTRAAGFDGHLVKPIDYERLVATVGRVLGLTD